MKKIYFILVFLSAIGGALFWHQNTAQTTPIAKTVTPKIAKAPSITHDAGTQNGVNITINLGR